MPRRRVDQHTYRRIHRLLHLTWKPKAIAEVCAVSVRTVQRIEATFQRYGSIRAPRRRALGKPRTIFSGAMDKLLEYVSRHPGTLQKDMVWFLWEQFGVKCDRTTVSRALRRAKWSKKKGQRMGPINETLRAGWRAEMCDITAEQLVFIDESSFNKTTAWRREAWAPIGDPARYYEDPTRGSSWSVLPAYTVSGYLSCTGVKEGYYDTEAFLDWIEHSLLPQCQEYPGDRSVIVMDNASIHCNPQVQELIERSGCVVKYLPPYSPDYNPIELSFAVLKNWLRSNYHVTWPSFEGDFGGFLHWAIEQSQCDQYAVQHFRYSAGGGYIFSGDPDELERQLQISPSTSEPGDMPT